jgi:hypothetical protein
MCIVAALDPMRFEHQVIPYPNRVEAIGLGALRAFQAICHRCMPAKMRQQQAEFQFCPHNVSSANFGYFLHNPIWQASLKNPISKEMI